MCESATMFQLLTCRQCGGSLRGRQTHFCSRRCKNNSTNTRHQIYASQKRRGAARKWQLVQMLGGRCQKCGYGANLAALEFHHASGHKDFQLDMRSVANRSWSAILAEVLKCELLCSNCHAETRRPDLAVESIPSLVQEGSSAITARATD